MSDMLITFHTLQLICSSGFIEITTNAVVILLQKNTYFQ